MVFVPELTQSDLYRMRRKEEKGRKIEWAKTLYTQGMSLYEISNKVGLPERTLVTELGLG